MAVWAAGQDGGLQVQRTADDGRREARRMLATPRPFIAFIRRQAPSRFHVSFPDFPGCASSGYTIAEAKRNAEHALASECWRLRCTGQPLPLPSSMRELAAAGGRTDGLVILVAPPSLSA